MGGWPTQVLIWGFSVSGSTQALLWVGCKWESVCVWGGGGEGVSLNR